jgi:transposase
MLLALALQTLGFLFKPLKGKVELATKIFLKIYLYGYLNGLRSARKLEKECARNIELNGFLRNHTQLP